MITGTGVEPVLLVKPKVEAEDLEELPPLEDGSTGPGWLQKHHVLGSTDPAGRQTHSCGDKDAGSTEGSDDAALQIAPVLSVSYRPRRSDKVTTVMRWLDGVQPSPDGSLQVSRFVSSSIILAGNASASLGTGVQCKLMTISMPLLFCAIC